MGTLARVTLSAIFLYFGFALAMFALVDPAYPQTAAKSEILTLAAQPRPAE